MPSHELEITLAPLPPVSRSAAVFLVVAFAVATYAVVAASFVVAFGVDSALAVEPVAAFVVALAVESAAAFVVAFVVKPVAAFDVALDVKPAVASLVVCLVVGPSVDVVSRGRVRSRTRGTVHIMLFVVILWLCV